MTLVPIMIGYHYRPVYDRVGYMTKLKFTIDNLSTGWNEVVINLPTALTIKERRLHRACLDYEIRGGYLYDTNNNAKVKFATAPDNWAVRAALKRGRNMWLEMHREIFKSNPQLKPKWHDFKPALSVRQHFPTQPAGLALGYETHQVPNDVFDINAPRNEQGITWSVFTTEDGRPSNLISNQPVVDVNKDEWTSHLIGHHLTQGTETQQKYTSVGLLESWINSRPDMDPINTISDMELDRITADPLTMLFNDGDADNEIIENFNNAVQGDGDQEGDAFPSYHLTSPVGGSIDGAVFYEEQAAACTTAQSPISYFTGFNALLGQILLRINMSDSGSVDIVFDVDPKGASI